MADAGMSSAGDGNGIAAEADEAAEVVEAGEEAGGEEADSDAIGGNVPAQTVAADGNASGDNASAEFFMYVVSCADGSLYTGYATDVERRVAQHNAGEGAKYTRSRGPVQLVAQARFSTQHAALSVEYRFKRLTRTRKLELIARADGSSKAFARILAAEFDLGAKEL